MISKLFRKKEKDPLIAELAIAQVHMKTVEIAVRSAFGLNRPGDWLVELDHSRITWTFENGETLIAHAELIGTWSNASQTFMWAWANSASSADANAAVLSVRDYGQENGHKDLVEETIPCDAMRARGLAGLALTHSDLTCVLEQRQADLFVFLGVKMPKVEAVQ